MPRSDSSTRAPRGGRKGLTLVEVMLSTVIGSMLLTSMAYSSQEVTTAIGNIYDETMLQTVARDIQLGLTASLTAADKDGLPAQVQVSSTGMTIGKVQMRWTAADASSDTGGGNLQYSTDGGTTWTAMASMGSRGDIAAAEFAYGKFTPADDTDIPIPGKTSYILDDRVRGNLMRVDTTLGRQSMVPLYLQQVRAPRSLTWSWAASSSGGSPGKDSDGDGVPDDKDDFPLDPTRAYAERYPAAQGNLASVAFEDLYPSLGDADYNDMVASFYMKETYGPGDKANANPALRPGLTQVYMRFFAQARGAGYHHALRLNVASLMKGGGDISIQRYNASGTLMNDVKTTAAASPIIDIFPDTAVQLPAGSDGWSTNTVPNTSFVGGWSTVVSLTFADPGQNRYDTTMDPPYDTFLHVFNTNSDIHLPMCNSAGGTTGIIDSYRDPASGAISKVVDSKGDPWALLVPGNWAWPLEGQDIHEAYPQFAGWVAAGHPQGSDWFAYPVTNRYKTASLNSGGQAAPTPIAQTNFNDPDTNGNARYAYIFEPAYFTGGSNYGFPLVATTVAPSTSPVPTTVPAGSGLYPIALSQAALSGHAVGDSLDILCGTGPGNFGWLSWTGATDEGTLATSLSAPGNSNTYVDPTNAGNHTLAVGCTVSGSTGVKNSSAVRAALNNLEASEILVPVYDTGSGNGANATYHVVAFAKVQITSYTLPGTATINATFKGWANADGTLAAAPTAPPTQAPTATPVGANPPVATNLYPIALDASLLAGKAAGSQLGEVPAGFGSDHFCWVTWNGDQSDAIFRGNMVPPGNAGTYSNPANGTDHHLDPGDNLVAFTDVSNTSSVRGAIANVLNTDLVVPVFNGYTAATGQIAVGGFAKVKIVDAELRFKRDRLNLVFDGNCDSAGNPANPTPTGTQAASATPTIAPSPSPSSNGHHHP